MQSPFYVTRISDPAFASVHAYYDCCPESPDGTRVTCFRFDDAVPGPGRVEVRHRDGKLLTFFGVGACGNGHVGCFPAWADDDSILWVDGPDGLSRSPITFVRKITSAVQHGLPGRIRQFHPAKGLGLIQEIPAGPQNPHDLFQALSVCDSDGVSVARIDVTDGIRALPPDVVAPDQHRLTFMNGKWAPDGSCFMVVFTTEAYRKRTGDSQGPHLKCILIAQADGTGLRFLGSFAHHPSWTPDGAGIIAYQKRADGGQDVLRFDATTGAQECLLTKVRGVHPTMSPDGCTVVTDVFDTDKGRASLVRFSLPHGTTEILAEFPHIHFDHRVGHHPHPVFSRDGRRLYFNAEDGGRCGVYALDLGARLG